MRFLPAVPVLLAACASASPAYVDEGREAARRGDHEKAVTLFSKAIESEPESAEAWYARGYSHVRLRRDPNSPGEGRAYEERAIADFTQAIQLNPSYGDAYYNVAMVYASRAMYRQAAENLISAIRFKAQDPEPHYALARIYEEKFQDMGPQAMDHYEKYADLGGRDREAREKARLWKETSELRKKAGAAVKPPTEEDEKKAQELYERMKALLKDDKRQEAVKVAEELMSVYGRTRFVQDPKIIPGLKALVAAFKDPKPPPPK